jgi:predicted protein tyrosine phosphatase
VLGAATLPAVWYVVDFESDVDPEFPTVIRPTFNRYPPAAYRFAEPGDTIDHIAIYVAAAALVLALLGLYRGSRKRAWCAALALSLAGFWHACTPGPLMDGWYGLGWRTIFNPEAGRHIRLLLAGAAAALFVTTHWGLGKETIGTLWRESRGLGTAWLIVAASALVLARQVGWLDCEPAGFWPRWMLVWGLLAWALALLFILPATTGRKVRRVVVCGLVLLWLGLDFLGRGVLWHQRPLHRLREVVAGRIYISAMPTYQGLQLAQARHHFRTIVNLFPEYSPERSPLLAEEMRFAREHGLNFVANEASDDATGEAFIARTLALAQKPSAWPILVHCHASMDRSPAWMGLYRFVVQKRSLDDALREVERHRGLRPKASVTLLYNRILPLLAPERAALDPTLALLRKCALGAEGPAGGPARTFFPGSNEALHALKPALIKRR